MNLKAQNLSNQIFQMESSIAAVECLVNQASFDSEVQSLLKVLAKDLRSSYSDLVPVVLRSASFSD